MMILITGGTGFLGKYIVQDLLSEGYELRLLVRNPAQRDLPSWHNLVEIVEGDILDVLSLEKAMEGVNQVIHAAALVSFGRRDKQLLMHVNAEGTSNIVDACLESEVERLVHVSSIAAVGHTNNGSLITEQTPWVWHKLRSGYSKSKFRAEMEVYRGIAEGLNAVILNPSVILGADDQWDQGTVKMFSIIDRGLSFYNTGSNGFVAAEDVAVACRLLLNAPVDAGERFLLSAENHSYYDLLSMIARALDKPAPHIKLPSLPTLWVGRISEWVSYLTGNSPIISLESMRSSLLSRAYDGSKITSLGLQYTPINEVISKTADVFQKRFQPTHRKSKKG